MNNESSERQLIATDPPTLAWAAELSSFIQSQLATPLPERAGFIRWKLCENPARSGFASAVVLPSTGVVVSTCTVTSKRWWYRNVEQLWGEIGDTFTAPAYLRQGMFGTLVNASRSRAQAAGLEVVYGLPNDQTLPGYVKKLGFSIKEDVVLDRFVAITSTNAIGIRTRASRSELLRGILCHPAVVRWSHRLARLAFNAVARSSHRIRIEREGSFGPEFDDLWQRVRRSLACAQVRDAPYLAWRYGRNPFPVVVFSAKNGSSLLGYVATLTLRHEGENELTHTILLDWLYDPEAEPATRKGLLAAAVRHAMAENADVISAVTSRTTPLPLPFKQLGFVRAAPHLPVIIHGNSAGTAVRADPTRWHFTLSDTDSF